MRTSILALRANMLHLASIAGGLLMRVRAKRPQAPAGWVVSLCILSLYLGSAATYIYLRARDTT